MKPSRLLLAAGIVAGAAAFALAGPPPQLTIHPPSTAKSSAVKTPPVTALAPTAAMSAPAPATVVSCATCACCKKTS